MKASKLYSVASNFATSIAGELDLRPYTWGTAGYHEWPLVFYPPAGTRVRIVRLYGDLIAWPLGLPPEGTFAGVLVGFMNTGPEGSQIAYPAADNCMLYLQVGVGREPARADFDVDVSPGGLLREDNTLKVRLAVWLNTTGLPIHMETSFVAVFKFEEVRDEDYD